MNTKEYLILFLLILPMVVCAQYSNSSTVKVEQSGVNYIHMDYINTPTGVYINDGRTHILKNWTNNGAVNFTSGVTSGETRFEGTAQQTISGSGTTDYQNVLFVNAIADPAFLLQKEVNVYGNVDFTDGVVRESGAGLTVFQDNATHTNVSDASFVDGKVRKIGDDAFVFPIGDDDGGTTFRYRNAAISAPAAGDSFDAQYFWEQTTHDVSSKQSTIDVIDTGEYWQIDQVVGSTLVGLTLGWDAATTMPASLYADTSKLIIVRWDGSEWVNEGGVVSAATSTITATVSGYGTFALATKQDATIPDYKVTVETENATVLGSDGQSDRVIDFIVVMGGFDGNSNGVDPVEFRIIKDRNLVITYDDALATLNDEGVNNADWRYEETASLYKFIYIGNGGIFQKNTRERIGINAVYNPDEGSRGLFPLKATIRAGSGGETNGTNNNDVDYINYVN